MKNSNLFWISFSDIMTSLFFIMLVLFVVTTAYYYSSYRTAQEKIDEINSIETALKSLDEEFFDFNEKSKRYRLNIDVQFHANKSNIYVVDQTVLNSLTEAGQNLYERIDNLLAENQDVNLMLVIEGNAARSCANRETLEGCNWIEIPNDGYILSYQRALALFNYWKDNQLDFNRLIEEYNERFEVIIAGSGYYGLSREDDETLNRRFTLQITSKYTLKPI